MRRELTHFVLLIAAVAGAAIAFGGGLTLMNVRADWAVVLGAVLCVAALLFGVVFVTRLLTEGKYR